MVWKLDVLDPADASLSSSDEEDPGKPEEHSAIGLRRIGLRQLGRIAIEEHSLRAFVERRQERCEAARRHEIDDRTDPAQDAKIGRLPNIHRRANRVEERVETLHRFVERLSLGDRQERLGPWPVGGDQSHERAVRLIEIVGELDGRRPPGASRRASLGSVRRSEVGSPRSALEKMRSNSSPAPAGDRPCMRDGSIATISAPGNRSARSALVDQGPARTSAIVAGLI